MQLTLPNLSLPTARPLVPVEAAMVLLDRSEDEILHAIEKGAIVWAWDIRSPGAERREIRIWRDSLLGELGDTDTRKRVWALSEDQVYATFIPRRNFRSPEIHRMFSCSSFHTSHLIELGQFEVAIHPTQERGINAAYVVTGQSVRAFLERRRLGR